MSRKPEASPTTITDVFAQSPTRDATVIKSNTPANAADPVTYTLSVVDITDSSVVYTKELGAGDNIVP
ncbi:hypothetical protein JNN96_24510 [Mycobacterium sp. DSM 3803]|nr:hypothetical protein [Mycobacterium sp. DSM 3803]OKH65947.1 hypothetical protein EB73_20795 [Mycobacterium sp. SWH-M3]